MVLIWQEPPYKLGLPQGDIDYDTPLHRDTDGRIEDEDVDYYSSITIFPSRCTSHTPIAYRARVKSDRLSMTPLQATSDSQFSTPLQWRAFWTKYA